MAKPTKGNKIDGTSAGEVIVGGNTPDNVDAMAGDDLVFGYGDGSGIGGLPSLPDPDGGGADDGDVLQGGDSNDRVYGGGGDDQLHGGDDDDALYGGAGDDGILGAQASIPPISPASSATPRSPSAGRTCASSAPMGTTP